MHCALGAIPKASSDERTVLRRRFGLEGDAPETLDAIGKGLGLPRERVRTRVRRSDGIIALVSKNSLVSSGQKWETDCAKKEKKKVLGLWAYTHDRTDLAGVNTRVWSWPTIREFIDSL